MQKTLVLLKPDAVARKLAGAIISRFEQKNINLVAVKLMTLNDEILAQHYAEHVTKGFYPAMAAFMKSSPVLALILEGNEVISVVRQMCGATNPINSLPGTIRGDFAPNIDNNIIHSSDSPESADREMKIFFPEIA